MRVLRLERNFISIAPPNISLTLCAEHIEERELRDSYKIPGVGSKDLSSDQKNKQCPEIYHNRILICVDTSLDTPTPL